MTPRSPAQGGETSPMPDAMKRLDPFMGEWTGTITSPGASGADGAPERVLPIRWTTRRVFDGRFVQFEFRSVEPNPQGRYVEWIGLFTFNPETKQYETIWMNSAIRRAPDRFMDGRLIFFETGTFDETGRVLTLISRQQRGHDQPETTVRSIFEMLGPDAFRVTDQELIAETGEYRTFGVFELKRQAATGARAG